MDRGASTQSRTPKVEDKIWDFIQLEIELGPELWMEWDSVNWSGLPYGWLIFPKG